MPVAALLALAISPLAAKAQIACARATSAIDRAICASPVLLGLDRDLVIAFGEALRRAPQDADNLRQAQRSWLAARQQACGAEPAARLPACLDQAFASRIATLAGKPLQAERETAPTWPAPSAASPPPVAAIALPAMPAPEARMSRDRFMAALDAPVMETLLEVTRPGRFALRTESPSGTALQLVDMLTGPSDISGQAGASDGRIDPLLDIGTYKLRAFAAAGATGETRLTATPFTELVPPALLRPGDSISGELTDLHQRGFWVVVDQQRILRLEAAGRALADLRIWRDGRELVNEAPAVDAIEPTAGHPLNRILFHQQLEPGTYLVTAYGGPALPWADGAAAQPFYLRLDASAAFAEGWLSGQIGPLGSEILSVQSQADSFRLELPEPAAVTLSVTTGEAEPASVEMARNSRVPVVTIRPGRRGNATRMVEIRGAAGQRFQLRAFGDGSVARATRAGNFLVAAEMPGLGGDDVPATAILLRSEQGQPDTVAAAAAPRIGTGQAWRARFNLNGAATLLMQVVSPGPVAVRTRGVALRASLQPLLGDQAPPPANGDSNGIWNLAAGWYRLRLEPQADATGILDLTVGPPGLLPDAPTPRQPSGPVLSFGPQTIAAGQSLRAIGNQGAAALIVRPLPLNLAAGPLVVTQPAGQVLELPLAGPLDGAVVATAVGEGPAAVEMLAGRTPSLRLPATANSRNLILAMRRPTPAMPRPLPRAAQDVPALVAGRPAFLDLARDASRSFALKVAEGGLYRVETTGRVMTTGRLGTAFIPGLAASEASAGIGSNMLIQCYLRAGLYQLTIQAQGSSGRLGVLARPAPLLQGGVLRPEGGARIALPAGTGVAFPLEIAEAGRFRFDLLSLGRVVRARLEDAEGWPILPDGALDGTEQSLPAGRYRLVVEPVDVESRVLARLTTLRPAVILSGHGPHALGFGAVARNQWREPAGRGAPRDPDLWEFSLAGPADVTIAIGDGMGAALHRMAAEAPGERVGLLAGGTPVAGSLPAGRYRIMARATGRNDRLDYTLQLTSDALQPGSMRRVTLPATLPFAIAEDRVVGLTSFGNIDLRAVLRDGEGRVVARDDDRSGDWNIAMSRLLPVGRYTLELLPAATLDTKASPGNSSGEDAEDDAASPEDAPADQDDSTTEMSPEDETLAAARMVEIRLTLPEANPEQALPPPGDIALTGGSVHRLSLPAAPEGSLMVVTARSDDELVLSLERRQADGTWRAVGTDRGLAPLLAAPAEAGAQWRAAVWAVDGGASAIRFSARFPAPPAQSLGPVATATTEGLPELAVARIALPDAAAVMLAGPASAWLAGSMAGQALTPPEAGIILPQSRLLWLLSRGGMHVDVTALRPDAAAPLVLNLAAGTVATLPAGERPRIWIARGDAAALDAGLGMDLAQGSAFAFAAPGVPLRLRGASGDTASRASLRLLEPDMLEPLVIAGQGFGGTLAAHGALPLRLPPGRQQVRLDLPPGVGAVLGRDARGAATVWSGDTALSRLLEGDWGDILLVNTTDGPLPAAISLSPAGEKPMAVTPDSVLRRFFGAAGSVALPVAAAAGQRLAVAGATGWHFVDAKGQLVRDSLTPLSGPGWLVVEHGPGPVLVWLEGAGSRPWPETPPRAVSMPVRMAMEGPAMALALAPEAPALVHVSISAPVLLGLDGETPTLFAVGAEQGRFLPAGPATLRLLPPQDGPLTGTLTLTAMPVRPIGEGLGQPVMVAPGGTALFGFTLGRDATLGLGVRADPDRAVVRLLDARGGVVGEGVAQLRPLPTGRYVLEARIPADGVATVLRPALVGLDPRPAGPPAAILREYQAMTGIAPAPGAAEPVR
jgi:uncharacterized protein YecT (DUF1311 family)